MTRPKLKGLGRGLDALLAANHDDDAERGDIGSRAHRPLDDRAELGPDVERHAHAVERQHDVGVQHGGVDAKPVDGHPRDTRGELRRARHLEDPVPLAQGAVLRRAYGGDVGVLSDVLGVQLGEGGGTTAPRRGRWLPRVGHATAVQRRG